VVPDLSSLVERFRREGEIVEVNVPVDADQELAEIHRRVIAADGPALLFTNVKGYDMPVATNLFGTRRRMDLTFGDGPERFVQNAVRLVQEVGPKGWKALLGAGNVFARAPRLGTKRVRHAPVTEVNEAPDLYRFPMIKQWPEDGGHFHTLPLVYTQHPETGQHNLGMYRIQRHGKDFTGMHWQIGKGGGFHHAAAIERGEELPVVLYAGGPPALIMSAIAPLPENVPELLFASLMLGEKLPMVKTSASPYPIVASAEVAFCGTVGPSERYPEGPFGDHYGYYSLQHDFPVFRVKRVLRRKNAIWPATVVGKPRQEDALIGDYLQRLMSPLFPLVMPGVRDLWTYGETGYHALAAAVVRERYRREAMSSALRILGEGQLSLTKFLWAVDKPMDLRDPKVVLPHLLARFRPETDLYVLSNVSMDTLDYAGPEINMGSKAIMLGVGDPVRELPTAFSGSVPSDIEQVEVFCPGCLVVSGPKWNNDRDTAERLASAFPGWPMVALVDDAKEAVRTRSRFLWTVFTRMEPARDLHSASKRIANNHLVFEGSILIDARFKDEYPGELFCDPAVAKTVSSRWGRYFPGGGVEMGDSDVAHLDRAGIMPDL